jgi:hypothetical protein
VLEIANRTPFPATIAPWTDRDGIDWAYVVVKGTFALGRPGATPAVAERQVPIQAAPVLEGEGLASSVRRPSDLGPLKPATDVALAGHAWAPRPRTHAVDVGVRVGPISKVLRVFGDRRWVRSLGGWVASPPVEFERVPLAWERAYGGVDPTRAEPPAFEPRNPAGTGFAATARPERLEGLALPNLEDVRHLITAWNARPPPACPGFVAPNWQPRLAFAGTYDEAWRRDRMPFLPPDFDERFLCEAVPELQARPHLVGGEPVKVVSASRAGDLTFALPRVTLGVTAWLRGQRRPAQPVLDTVLIEPDEERVVLTWRAGVRCPRQFLQLEAVEVRMEGSP